MYKWWDVHKKYPDRLIKANPHYDSVYTPKTPQEIEVAEIAKEFVWAYINLDKDRVRSMVLNPDAVDLQKFDTLYDKLAAIKDNPPIKKNDIVITWVVIPLGKSVMATATLKIVYGDSVFDYTLMFVRSDSQWKIESYYSRWFTIPEILDKVKGDRDKIEEFKDKKYETPKGVLRFGSSIEDIYKIYDPTDESFYEKSSNKEAITFKNKYAKDGGAITFYVVDNKIQSWREHNLNERAQNISNEVSNPRNFMLRQMNLKQDAGPAQELKAGPAEKEQTLDEIQTGFGRIAKGMTIAEVEKILPIGSRAFKNEARMGYKDITIYDNNWRNQTAGLWIELEGDKVKSMRLIK